MSNLNHNNSSAIFREATNHESDAINTQFQPKSFSISLTKIDIRFNGNEWVVINDNQFWNLFSDDTNKENENGFSNANR